MVNKSDFLIYCNGCSYSDDHYESPLMLNKTYSHVVGAHLNGFVINHSKSGSCNRRIVRTSAHDLILLRRQNPEQKIVALIQMTFDLRDEIWIDNQNSNIGCEVESNFQSNQFVTENDWKKKLLSGKSIVSKNPKLDPISLRFAEKWNQGRAFFYSPYAQRINLLLDVFFLKNLMNFYDIEYIVFQGPVLEKLEQEYLVDFFKDELASDNKIFDFEKFGFCQWCDENHFVPLGEKEQFARDIGHYGPDAHAAFANHCLIPVLDH